MVLFVGTKCDLTDDRKVELKYVKEFCKKHCLLPPIECSSKTGKDVDKVFQVVVTEMLKKGLLPKQLTKIKTVSSKEGCC